jgi:nucleoside-diphosphate-sugar epimerase
MRIAVLGGSGQIGKPLVSRLELLEHQVVSVDILDNSSYDLRNPKGDWIDVVSSSEFVFFLAFDVGGSKYLRKFEHTRDFLDNNLRIMCNVFEALDKSDIPFIFASSQMSQNNFSPYGTLKRLGEFYTSILGGLTCRFWNVYGIENDPEKRHVINDFLEMAKSTGVIQMRTDGAEYRQFLFAEDCVEALVRLMSEFSSLPKDVFYDVTSFEWTQISEVARIVAEYTNSKIEFSAEKDEVQLGSRNEPGRKILDIWTPQFGLKEGILRLLNEQH